MDIIKMRRDIAARAEALRVMRDRLAAAGETEDLQALQADIVSAAAELRQLRAAADAEETRQRVSVASQYIDIAKGEIRMKNSNRSAYIKALLNHTEPDQKILDALQITTAANPGNNLLPVTVSSDLLTDIYSDNGMLAAITMTQIKGLRIPKIALTDDGDDAVVTAGATAHAIDQTDGICIFNRFPGRDVISVPGSILRGTETALDAYLSDALNQVHRNRMYRRIFSSTATGNYAHMSVYKASLTNKTGSTMFEAIANAIGDLPNEAAANAKVVMTRAAYLEMIKELANGSQTLFGRPAEEILGVPVVFCAQATTPVVGDLSTIHVNYDDPMALETGRDAKIDMNYAIMGADYDIQIKQPERLRTVSVSA